MFSTKKFGPGFLVKMSDHEFHYREDTGKHYASKTSIQFWNPTLQGKHYDWLKVKTDFGYVKKVEGQETIEPKL